MPVIQVEHVAPDGAELGMLPFFMRDLQDGAGPATRRPGLLDIPLFGMPTRRLSDGSGDTPDRPMPLPRPKNGGFIPPFMRWLQAHRPGAAAPAPAAGPVLITPPPIPLPGQGPVLITPPSIPLPGQGPVLITPPPILFSDGPTIGAPASTATPVVPLPVVGAPAPPPVSPATASMFAAPSGGASMFASTGAPMATSMFGTVQGSGSQVARISGANALSGVPEDGGKTLLLTGLVVLGGLLLWGSHLNKGSKRGRAAR